MKARETALRLKRFEADEKNRKVQELEQMIREAEDLSDIEIRRIGNDQVRLREFQDRAIANSIAHL